MFTYTILNSTDDVDLLEVIEADESRQHVYVKDDGPQYEPVYEAKMFHQFDHRFGTYVGQTEAQSNQGKLPELSENEHRRSNLVRPTTLVGSAAGGRRARPAAVPDEWVFVFRDITSPVVTRTGDRCDPASLLHDRNVSLRILPVRTATRDAIALLANFNSMSFDFVCRTKFSGNHLSTFIVRQLPALPPEDLDRGLDGLRLAEIGFVERVLELTYTPGTWSHSPATATSKDRLPVG